MHNGRLQKGEGAWKAMSNGVLWTSFFTDGYPLDYLL